MARKPWQKLVQATTGIRREELITVTMQQYKIDRAAANKLLDDYDAGCTYWINDIYQVQRREFGDGLVSLNIRRRDGDVIFRDWRHFQKIKNELIGPECEAMELYPAESRLVDSTNKYHLFGVLDPTFRFPFGFQERDVITTNDNPDVPALRQRPIKEESDA